MRQEIFDALLGLGERHLPRGDQLVQLDDVIAVVGGDEVADLVRRETERRLLEFRHHGAARVVLGAGELVFALRLLRAGVFGEGGGEHREVFALARAIQHALGARLLFQFVFRAEFLAAGEVFGREENVRRPRQLRLLKCHVIRLPELLQVRLGNHQFVLHFAVDDGFGNRLLHHAVRELRARHAERAQVPREVLFRRGHLARVFKELGDVRPGVLFVDGARLRDEQACDEDAVEQLRFRRFAPRLGDVLPARREIGAVGDEGVVEFAAADFHRPALREHGAEGHVVGAGDQGRDQHGGGDQYFFRLHFKCFRSALFFRPRGHAKA